MEAQLDEELRAHLEHQVEKYVESGMSREEATRRAKIEFGGLDQVKEECRDSWGAAADYRTFAFGRLLRPAPVAAQESRHTSSSCGHHAGARHWGEYGNFSASWSSVLLAPPLYAQPNRLVVVWESNLRFGWHVAISYLNFRDWKRDAHSFQRHSCVSLSRARSSCFGGG